MQEEEGTSYYHWFVRNGKRIRLERMWPLEVFRARQQLAPGESYELATRWEVWRHVDLPRHWGRVLRLLKYYSKEIALAVIVAIILKCCSLT